MVGLPVGAVFVSRSLLEVPAGQSSTHTGSTASADLRKEVRAYPDCVTADPMSTPGEPQRAPLGCARGRWLHATRARRSVAARRCAGAHASWTRPFHLPPRPRAYCTAEWITAAV